MPSIPLHPPSANRAEPSKETSSIPPLLKTPLGLALMEIQGHINFPTQTDLDSTPTPIGRLVFPDCDASIDGAASEGPWMKKVYFYVGHQRMLGQVKKLPKALAVVGKKNLLAGDAESGMDVDETREGLEILEIVRWKIVFNSRPEPVGEGEND